MIFEKKIQKDIESWIARYTSKCRIPNIPEKEIFLEIPENYKNWIVDHCRYMDIRKLREKEKVIQVSLPEIFIHLYANPPSEKFEKNDELHRSFEEKQRLADIEDLITKHDYLLIDGLAGSGKTTLMKHFAYKMVQVSDWKGLNGCLPVLIFLKDVKALETDIEKNRPNATVAEKILTDYFERTGNGLNVELVKAFCGAGKAIFLVDGLDEIHHRQREYIVNSFGCSSSHKN